MSRVQETFRKVIDTGYYHGSGRDTSKFMCNALRNAFDDDVINEYEFSICKYEIEQCLTRSGYIFDSLSRCLDESNHKYYNKEDGLNNIHIYYDWDEKRPF